MRIKSLYCLVLGTLSFLALPSLAQGQQQVAMTYDPVALVSYNDLLSRMQQLESQIAARDNIIQQASYAVGGGGGGCGGGGCGGCGCCGGGWYGLYENVIVTPHFTSDSAFFIANDTAVNSAQHQQVSFDWDLEYSPRFELGYLNDCGGFGWRARYWYFDAEASETATVMGNDEIFAGWGGDGVNIDLDGVNSAIATHGLEMDVFDLEAQFRDCAWTYSAGIRLAQMDQTYFASELNAMNPEQIFARHQFDGWGPTMAAEVIKPSPIRGLSVFFKGRASLLFGQTEFLALNLVDGDRIDHASENDLMAVGELQLGVDWRTCVGTGRVLFVTAALEAQYWSSAGTGAPLMTDPNDDTNYHGDNSQSPDLGFYGFTIGTGLLY